MVYLFLVKETGARLSLLISPAPSSGEKTQISPLKSFSNGSVPGTDSTFPSHCLPNCILMYSSNYRILHV